MAAEQRAARRLFRRRAISLGVIAMSCGLTAVMSLVFYGSVKLEMLATGLVCAVIIDFVITRMTAKLRNQITSELMTTREELMVRDRMATAGTLAANVSHEIRQALSVIRFALDGVQWKTTDAEIVDMLGDIDDATERITLILQDLATLARPVDDPLSNVELATVVASAARLASYRQNDGVTLELGTLAAPRVIGNASRLVQVVLNLLVNAARATQPGVPNRVRVEAKPNGEHVVLSIADNGTGMSGDTLARVFEPFFTTGGDRGGTGLGLPICRSLVERMGGTIAIRSTPGTGTIVDVTLRRATTC